MTQRRAVALGCAALAAVTSLLVAAVTITRAWTEYEFQRPILHNYRLIYSDQQKELRADSIAMEGACVVFYRRGRVDTYLCPGAMDGTLIVTEMVEE